MLIAFTAPELIRVRLAPNGRRLLRRRRVLRVEAAVAAAPGAPVRKVVALRLRRR